RTKPCTKEDRLSTLESTPGPGTQRNVGTLATEWYEELQIEPDTYKWSAHDRTAKGLSSKYLTMASPYLIQPE
ncbi:hypothetical protein A2U01_0032521, partial [Trifolium medium]|nr:hypothetical protein [Trifolium medium]